MVGWFWDAGTAVNSSVDSCSQTVNAQWNNPTAGFSITSYEGGGGAGQTVAHGLGTTPDMFWIKRYDGSQDWACYHKDLGHENMITLNSATFGGDSGTFLNDTAPTNTLITLGTESRVNSSDSAIIYAWTGIPGFSKFESYTGNGNANGPFVYTGFRVHWLMIKDAENSNSWWVWNTKSDPSNPNFAATQLNATDSEYTGNAHLLDTLSNGFKINGTDDDVNGSGRNYIYAAFAEHPFKTARAK
jgi:hypothetical protein